MKKKMKDKYWKYATIILMIVGIASLFFSDATAFPTELSVNSTTDRSKNYDTSIAGAQRAYLITDFDSDKIDQLQDKLDVYYKIGFGSSGCGVLQPVVDDREPLTGFQVAIGRHGSPSEFLWIGIMYPSYGPPFNGNYAVVGYLQAVNVPEEDTFYWFGIDCSSNPVDIPSGLPAMGIVVVSYDDPDDSDYWMWGAGSGNPYGTYRPRGWNTQDNAWQNDMLSDGTVDMCFVTYTTSSGGNGGDVPVISITTTSWVTANIGFACLIGAAVSGIKYFSIIL